MIPLIRRLRECKKYALVMVAMLFFGTTLCSTTRAADLDFGKPGEPVKLVVGYLPFYTEAWSVFVLHDKQLWKKYLPAGSTVEFQNAVHGAVLVNQMLAGKQHIVYIGDMPAIISTTKQEVADVRMVAVLGLSYDQCNVFLVRNDAPQFKDSQEAVKWMHGKTVAVPQGGCPDRFAQVVFQKNNIKPAAYLNQNIEVITSGFRAGKLDASAVVEATASRLVQEGLARRVASGANFNELDGAFLTMRAELIRQRPDVVKAWLNAELDAQLFLADEKNAGEVIRMAKERNTGFSEKSLWMSLYGTYPESQGGTKTRLFLPFTFNAEAMDLINKATTFLRSIKAINVDKLRAEAVMPELAQQVLQERRLKSPIGEVEALPESAYTGK